MTIDEWLCYGGFILLLAILAVAFVAVVGTEIWRVVERRRDERALAQWEIDRLDRYRNRNVVSMDSYRRAHER